MGLAQKLHVIGNLISDDDTIAMIKNSNFKDSEHIVLTIDFKIENLKLVDKPKISRASLDNIKMLFTKKIGGTSNSYYLYPNFEYQGEKDIYKKFKASNIHYKIRLWSMQTKPINILPLWYLNTLKIMKMTSLS